jgi:hypothetical protein
LFWWEAPDGSRLLTYFPHDYTGGIEAESLAKDLSVWVPSSIGAGEVTVKQRPGTAKGIVFLTLHDETDFLR